MALNIAKATAKHEELKNANGDVPYFSFKEGVNILRILPPPPGKEEFWLEILKSYGVGPNEKTVVPRAQFGMPCPLQKHIDELYKLGDEISRKEADRMKPKRRIYIPIIDRTANPPVPMLLDINQNVFKDVLAYIADPSYGDITHPETGTDLKITYTKKTASGFPDWSVLAARERAVLTTDPQLMVSLTSTDWLETWKVNKPTDAEYIDAVLAGTEKEFNKNRNAAAQTAAQNAAPQQLPEQPVAQQQPAQMPTQFAQPVQQAMPAPGSRRFWVSDSGTVLDLTESEVQARYVDAGKSGYPVMLHGESVWKEPAAYGLFPTVHVNVPAPSAPVYSPPVPQPPQAPPFSPNMSAVPSHPPVYSPQPVMQTPASPVANPMEAALNSQLQSFVGGGPGGFPAPPPSLPAPGQSPVGQNLRAMLG